MTHKQPSSRWRVLILACLALALGACGGGVESGGTGSFGYSQGAITGFGSIVVNGVHFDESSATVLADDGSALNADSLQLGMTVEVRSGAIDATALTAVASQVRLRSELLGPISAIDTSAGTVTVLGQTVQFSVSTVFDSRISGGQAGLSLGQLVEVYAIPDPVSGVYAARRIEPVAAATQYKIRGMATQVSASQFNIGSAVFAYSAAPALTEGQQVRVLVATTLDASGRYVVAVSRDDRPRLDDNTATEVEGVIANYADLSNFQVAGLSVNASAATVEPVGSTLAAGQRVEVEGVVSAGVLRATKVSVKAADDGGSSGSGGSGGGSGGGDDGKVEFEVDGRVTALDTTAKSLVVRGVTIAYASATFEGGTASQLALNQRLEIKGVLAADGLTVTATRIKFDH